MTQKVKQPLSKDAKHSPQMKTRYPTPRRTKSARSSPKGCRLFTTAGTYARLQVTPLRKTVRLEKQDVHRLNFFVDYFPHKRRAYYSLYTRDAIMTWSKLSSAFYPVMKRLWLASNINRLPWVYLDVPNLCHLLSRRFCPIPWINIIVYISQHPLCLNHYRCTICTVAQLSGEVTWPALVTMVKLRARKWTKTLFHSPNELVRVVIKMCRSRYEPAILVAIVLRCLLHQEVKMGWTLSLKFVTGINYIYTYCVKIII